MLPWAALVCLGLTVTGTDFSNPDPVTVTLVVFAVLGISMTTVLTYCWHQKAKYQDRNLGGPEDSDHNLEAKLWQLILANLMIYHCIRGRQAGGPRSGNFQTFFFSYFLSFPYI